MLVVVVVVVVAAVAAVAVAVAASLCASGFTSPSVCFNICVVLELVDGLFSVWYECKS